MSIDGIIREMQNEINGIAIGFRAEYDWLDGDSFVLNICGNFNVDWRNSNEDVYCQLNTIHYNYGKKIAKYLIDNKYGNFVMHESEGYFWCEGEEVSFPDDYDFDCMQYMFYTV